MGTIEIVAIIACITSAIAAVIVVKLGYQMMRIENNTATVTIQFGNQTETVEIKNFEPEKIDNLISTLKEYEGKEINQPE